MNFLKEISIIKKLLDEFKEDFILKDSYNYLDFEIPVNRKFSELFIKKLIYFIFYITAHNLKNIYKIIFSRSSKSHNNFKSNTMSFFFGTFNQFKTLKELIIDDNKAYNLYTINTQIDKILSKKHTKYDIKYKKRNLLITLLFSFIRIKDIYKNVFLYDTSQYKYLISLHHSIYLWLSVFLNTFDKGNDKLIIFSNCHNKSNISLILVCKILNIKTAYIQHATITSNFTPLICDFNFLDGMYSYNQFKKIEKKFENLIKYKRNIYLIGNLISNKIVNLSNNNIKKEKIGICIGLIDDIEKILLDCNFCIANGYQILIRFHPRETKIRENYIKQNLGEFNSVSMHNAIEMNLNDFLNQTFCCLSCCSAIQLESAIANVPNIYCDWHSEDVFKEVDRYEFIKNGISFQSSKQKNLLLLLKQAKKGYLIVKPEMIKYYSESFGSKNFGKESKLILSNLKNIINNCESEKLFGQKESF